MVPIRPRMSPCPCRCLMVTLEPLAWLAVHELSCIAQSVVPWCLWWLGCAGLCGDVHEYLLREETKVPGLPWTWTVSGPAGPCSPSCPTCLLLASCWKASSCLDGNMEKKYITGRGLSLNLFVIGEHMIWMFELVHVYLQEIVDILRMRLPPRVVI